MNKALVGITAATGLALAITTMVGHGQNVASGQSLTGFAIQH